MTTTTTIIETIARDCAADHIAQGTSECPAQGVAMDGDWEALERALGREATAAETRAFEQAFVAVFRSMA